MKTLILFSGGADSVLMLHLARKLGRQATLLSYKYGQKHLEEVDYGRRYVDNLLGPPVPQLTIDLTQAFSFTRSSLLAGVQEGNYPGVHAMHVPARNLVFLAVALSVAETHGHEEIWHGADYSDRVNLFPDCYQEYFVKLNELSAINGSRKIAVRAPLLGLTKEDVKAALAAEGIDLATIYSGYQAPDLAKPQR